ncbi:class I SAM-dependent methyltransferase [Flavobacterium sp.]|uniref:class I SAM-dependent methyltransferase n=1 Tax=Flavobacterium sp. TaxID=239 RepID=UPI002FDCE4BC
MKADFDQAAANYDHTFTHTEIGQMQRALVYGELSNHLHGIQTILEINCGTGEDAVWFSKKNYTITATDISPKMIDIAKSKANLHFAVADINSITTTFAGEKFDLLFSNFGGLNCLSRPELEQFFREISSILSPQGKMALVIMPKNTLWERLYFLAKAQFKNSSRRKKASVIAKVDGENVTTFYYNPKDIVTLANTNFEITAVKPIGFFVPPSYLNDFFTNKKGLLRFLNRLEQGVKHWSWLSKYADHYLIILQKK